MPLPLAHALVGASVATAILSPQTPHRYWKILLSGLLAVIPDLDFFFVWVLGWDRTWHRGFTHSMVFAVVGGVLARLIVNRRHALQSQRRDLWAYCLAMMSHGFLDALFSFEGGGVELLWPFTASRYKLGYTALLESTETWRHMLSQSVLEAVIFVPIFAVVLWLRRARRG